MPHYTTRKQAIKCVAALPKPKEISNTRWRGVRTYLLAIAQHYPKAYPSQQALAAEVACSVRSIREYQVLCQRLGLLHVTADAGVKGRGNTWSKTHRYHITIAAESAGMSAAESAYKDPTGHYVPLQVVTSFSLSTKEELSSGSASGLTSLPTTVGRVPSKKAPRPRRPSAKEAIDGADSGRRQEARPERKPSRQQLIVEYFDAAWHEMTSNPRARDLRQIRVVENLGACRKYAALHFANADDKQVREWIDTFVAQVFRSDLRVKEGQSAWQLFTGTWGKYHNTAASTREQEYADYRERNAQ